MKISKVLYTLGIYRKISKYSSYFGKISSLKPVNPFLTDGPVWLYEQNFCVWATFEGLGDFLKINCSPKMDMYFATFHLNILKNWNKYFQSMICAEIFHKYFDVEIWPFSQQLFWLLSPKKLCEIFIPLVTLLLTIALLRRGKAAWSLVNSSVTD